MHKYAQCVQNICNKTWRTSRHFVSFAARRLHSQSVPTVTRKKLRAKMNDLIFNAGGDAAEDYARLLGHRVIIYYQDQRGTDRKLVGRITEIDGDRMWLENVHKRTGELWRGAINCRNCRIGIISTIQGWSGKEDEMA